MVSISFSFYSSFLFPVCSTKIKTHLILCFSYALRFLHFLYLLLGISLFHALFKDLVPSPSIHRVYGLTFGYGVSTSIVSLHTVIAAEWFAYPLERETGIARLPTQFIDTSTMKKNKSCIATGRKAAPHLCR